MVEGNYQGLVRRLRCELRNRYEIAETAVRRRLPQVDLIGGVPGSALWLRCPAEVCERTLEVKARELGVVFESGDPFFAAPQERVYLRLGLSTIPSDRIDPGIERLAEAMAQSI